MNFKILYIIMGISSLIDDVQGQPSYGPTAEAVEAKEWKIDRNDSYNGVYVLHEGDATRGIIVVSTFIGHDAKNTPHASVIIIHRNNSDSEPQYEIKGTYVIDMASGKFSKTPQPDEEGGDIQAITFVSKKLKNRVHGLRLEGAVYLKTELVENGKPDSQSHP